MLGVIGQFAPLLFDLSPIGRLFPMHKNYPKSVWETVRAYLIAQGLDPNSITTTGYGMSQPVADNSTPAGRQKNRRVEIVISGELIGVKIGIKPGMTP